MTPLTGIFAALVQRQDMYSSFDPQQDRFVSKDAINPRQGNEGYLKKCPQEVDIIPPTGDVTGASQAITKAMDEVHLRMMTLLYAVIHPGFQGATRETILERGRKAWNEYFEGARGRAEDSYGAYEKMWYAAEEIERLVKYEMRLAYPRLLLDFEPVKWQPSKAGQDEPLIKWLMTEETLSSTLPDGVILTEHYHKVVFSESLLKDHHIWSTSWKIKDALSKDTVASTLFDHLDNTQFENFYMVEDGLGINGKPESWFKVHPRDLEVIRRIAHHPVWSCFKPEDGEHRMVLQRFIDSVGWNKFYDERGQVKEGSPLASLKPNQILVDEIYWEYLMGRGGNFIPSAEVVLGFRNHCRTLMLLSGIETTFSSENRTLLTPQGLRPIPEVYDPKNPKQGFPPMPDYSLENEL